MYVHVHDMYTYTGMCMYRYAGFKLGGHMFEKRTWPGEGDFFSTLNKNHLEFLLEKCPSDQQCEIII